LLFSFVFFGDFNEETYCAHNNSVEHISNNRTIIPGDGKRRKEMKKRETISPVSLSRRYTTQQTQVKYTRLATRVTVSNVIMHASSCGNGPCRKSKGVVAVHTTWPKRLSSNCRITFFSIECGSVWWLWGRRGEVSSLRGPREREKKFRIYGYVIRTRKEKKKKKKKKEKKQISFCFMAIYILISGRCIVVGQSEWEQPTFHQLINGR
jgi:hypothetical protein